MTGAAPDGSLLPAYDRSCSSAAGVSYLWASVRLTLCLLLGRGTCRGIVPRNAAPLPIQACRYFQRILRQTQSLPRIAAQKAIQIWGFPPQILCKSCYLPRIAVQSKNSIYCQLNPRAANPTHLMASET